MEKIRLGYMHVAAGKPLPFELFDEHGRVLLKPGYVIQSEAQLERLVERGAFFDLPFDEVSQQQKQVSERTPPHVRNAELLDAFVRLLDKKNPDCAGVLEIAEDIQAFCESNGDMALAGIQLQKTNRYSLRHSFHTAVLSEMLLKRLGLPSETRQQAIAGALTMNVCMLELQDTLYAQSTPLAAEQKRALVIHSQMAVQTLREQGISHPVWLDVVEHHHEMIDGSGYAKRLRKEDLSVESQAVSLADRFCAMVSERGYRAGVPPSATMKHLLERQATTIDPVLASAFLKEVGIYPPGTVVTLANGEVGIVVKRLLNPAHPLVRSLRSASGIRYAEPPKRVTSKSAHAIKDALDTDAVKHFDVEILWQAMLLGEVNDGSTDAE